MTISLSEAHLELARRYAAAGGFASVEAYLAHLLEEIDARERATAELRAEIMKGWEQAEQGLGIPMTDEWLEEKIAAGRKRWAERRQNGAPTHG